MFARMGGVLAPTINMLDNQSPTTPLVIFGTCPLVGAVLALALPETADRPLPDTVEEAENWDMRYYNVLPDFTPGLLRCAVNVSLLLSLCDPEQDKNSKPFLFPI